MTLTTVVFDLFITLTDFESERRRPAHATELAAALGVETESFADVLRSSFTERATGAMGDLESTMRTLAERCGATPSDVAIEEAATLRLEQQLFITQPRVGVVSAIERLRRSGAMTGLLSDCTPEIGELWSQLPYEPLFDATMFSFVRGLRKPAPELYLELAERMGVAPEECLYVGDGGSNELTGAAAVGMTPVLLETPLEDAFRYDAGAAWAGLSIRTIDEVAGLLESLNEQSN